MSGLAIGLTVAQAQVSHFGPIELPDMFEVSFEPGAFARLLQNDGRSFTLDDPSDLHDGTYNVDPAATGAGPVPLTAPVLSGAGEVGALLTIAPPLFAYDAGLGEVTLSYTASGANPVDDSDPFAPVLLVSSADAETALTVTVTAVQNGVSAALTSNALSIAPPSAAPLISGVPVIDALSPRVGDVLNASPAAVTGEPAPLRTWQWARDGQDIPGATSASYTVQASDAGQALLVRQIETNSEGVDSALSAPTAMVEPALAAPAILGLPTIDNTAPQVGDVLTASAADVTGEPLPTRSWQWFNAAGSIAGATSATYSVQTADIGQTLFVRQTETNSQGTDTATSAATLAVLEPFSVVLMADGTLEIAGNDGREFTIAAAEDSYEGSYSVDPGTLVQAPVALVATALSAAGTPVVGDTLTITPALFAYDPDEGPVSISYATNAANAVNDSDPDAPTLLLAAADAGQVITVTATATQGSVTTDSLSNGVSVEAAPAGWNAPTAVAGEGQASITAGANEPTAPAAPIVVADGEDITLTEAA